MAEKPVFHARTKHIEVHYHYIREKVLEEEIEMVPTKTEEQIVDILTKGLHKAKFEKFRKMLGMVWNKVGHITRNPNSEPEKPEPEPEKPEPEKPEHNFG